MTLQTIEQCGLIRVNDPARPGDLDELRFVDFPRRTPGSGPLRRFARERVHAFFRTRVIDESEIDERLDDLETGLFERLAAGRCFERLVWIGRTFGDSPRRAPVVIACGMDEQNFDRALDESIQQRARR